MDEIARINRISTGIELDIVDAIHRPIKIMGHTIQVHLAGLSLKNTVITLDQFGISRAKSTVHNWIQKADLEPRSGCEPNKVGLDETVVKAEGEQ